MDPNKTMGLGLGLLGKYLCMYILVVCIQVNQSPWWVA
jgi:hypothetical protein